MKISVSPAKGCIWPAASTAVSSSRRLVVPTAIMRPPAWRAAVIAAAASAAIIAAFGVHRVLGHVVDAHRQKRAGADMQRHRHVRRRRAAVNACQQ